MRGRGLLVHGDDADVRVTPLTRSLKTDAAGVGICVDDRGKPFKESLCKT